MKLRAKIIKAWLLQCKVEHANIVLSKLKSQIATTLNEHDVKKFVAEAGSEPSECPQCSPRYLATVTNRTSIKYDIEKLKEVLDADLFAGITSWDIKIDSPKLFMSTMKSLGLKSKDVRKFATFSRVLDKDKLNQMYDVGEISLKELKECYTANTTSSVKIILQEESDNN